MAKRRVFYSFHFDNDVFRVQLVRNIGVLESNEPVSKNDWEQIQRRGEPAIRSWIDTHLSNKDCLVVLVGSDTANRQWVHYEIEKAWQNGMGVVGIYIHNLMCARTRSTCIQGANPFARITIPNMGAALSNVVQCYNPKSYDAYNDIEKNLERLIEEAIAVRKR